MHSIEGPHGFKIRYGNHCLHSPAGLGRGSQAEAFSSGVGKGPSESSRDRDIRKQCEQLEGIGSTLMLPASVIRDAANILTEYRSRSAPIATDDEKRGEELGEYCQQKLPGSGTKANGEEIEGSSCRGERSGCRGEPGSTGEVPAISNSARWEEDGVAAVGKRRRWHNLPALLAAVLYVAARRAGLGIVIPEVAAAAGSDARMVATHYR